MSANVMLLPEDVRHALALFRDEMRRSGIRSVMTSGFRSREKQAELYTLFKGGLSPYPVAPPGSSRHETGRAVDLVITPHDRLPDAARIGQRYGFKWAGKSDEVHFTYVHPKPGAFIRVGGREIELKRAAKVLQTGFIPTIIKQKAPRAILRSLSRPTPPVFHKFTGPISISRLRKCML